MQLRLHFDSASTLQTNQRHVATVPQNTEALRAKYEVLTNFRKLHADFAAGSE